MTRPRMFDAIHVNVGTIPPGAEIVAGYDTGLSNVKWVTADWNIFLPAQEVHVDQSGGAASLGGPVFSANVMDVEPFCYTVNQIPGWTSKCTAPRPTVYCDRNDLPDVQAIWNGDVWLAAPGLSDDQATAIMEADPRIVAVQNLDAGSFDASVIGDAFWPLLPPPPVKPPVKGKEMLNGMIDPNQQIDIPFPVDTFDAICLYANDIGGGSVHVTVILNAGGGQSVWTQTLGANAPVTVPFPHPHAIAVSLSNTGTTDVGWTLINQ
jgi:hypothetical protein